jgi:hypothetical protein
MIRRIVIALALVSSFGIAFGFGRAQTPTPATVTVAAGQDSTWQPVIEQLTNRIMQLEANALKSDQWQAYLTYRIQLLEAANGLKPPPVPGTCPAPGVVAADGTCGCPAPNTMVNGTCTPPGPPPPPTCTPPATLINGVCTTPPPPTGSTGWLGSDVLTGTLAIGSTVTINKAGPLRDTACTVAGGALGNPGAIPVDGTVAKVVAGPSPLCRNTVIYWQVQF